MEDAELSQKKVLYSGSFYSSSDREDSEKKMIGLEQFIRYFADMTWNKNIMAQNGL